MTLVEIIEAYREQGRARLAAAWEELRDGSFRGVVTVRNFDPYLWSLDHVRVAAAAARRPALAEWCHRRCGGRWMFNELPGGDSWLFELPADAAAFREAAAAGAESGGF
jgi:hypothetical protein